jgi:hypothetical protein
MKTFLCLFLIASLTVAPAAQGQQAPFSHSFGYESIYAEELSAMCREWHHDHYERGIFYRLGKIAGFSSTSVLEPQSAYLPPLQMQKQVLVRLWQSLREFLQMTSDLDILADRMRQRGLSRHMTLLFKSDFSEPILEQCLPSETDRFMFRSHYYLLDFAGVAPIVIGAGYLAARIVIAIVGSAPTMLSGGLGGLLKPVLDKFSSKSLAKSGDIITFWQRSKTALTALLREVGVMAAITAVYQVLGEDPDQEALNDVAEKLADKKLLSIAQLNLLKRNSQQLDSTSLQLLAEQDQRHRQISSEISAAVTKLNERFKAIESRCIVPAR